MVAFGRANAAALNAPRGRAFSYHTIANLQARRRRRTLGADVIKTRLQG